MNTAMKITLGVTAALGLSSVAFSLPAVAQPDVVWAGPGGGCPAGYRHAGNPRKCRWFRGPGVGYGPAPVGGWIAVRPGGICGPGYHVGPWRERCYANGRQEWIGAGPGYVCRQGWRLGPDRRRCYPL